MLIFTLAFNLRFVNFLWIARIGKCASITDSCKNCQNHSNMRDQAIVGLAPGVRFRNSTRMVVFLNDLWRRYAEVLRGEQCLQFTSAHHLVSFRVPDLPYSLSAEVLADPGFGNSRVIEFLADNLAETSNHGTLFVFLCIGEPPQEPGSFELILESFHEFGAWVGDDVVGRKQLLFQISQARQCYFLPCAIPNLRRVMGNLGDFGGLELFSRQNSRSVSAA